MPKYYYKCNNCDEELEVRHGISDCLSDCEECSMPDSLIRIPQLNFKVEVKKRNEKVGSKVNEAIRENKKLLQQMKKEGAFNDIS